jgi:hypothetical protein
MGRKRPADGDADAAPQGRLVGPTSGVEMAANISAETFFVGITNAFVRICDGLTRETAVRLSRDRRCGRWCRDRRSDRALLSARRRVVVAAACRLRSGAGRADRSQPRGSVSRSAEAVWPLGRSPRRLFVGRQRRRLGAGRRVDADPDAPSRRACRTPRRQRGVLSRLDDRSFWRASILIDQIREPSRRAMKAVSHCSSGNVEPDLRARWVRWWRCAPPDPSVLGGHAPPRTLPWGCGPQPAFEKCPHSRYLKPSCCLIRRSL